MEWAMSRGIMRHTEGSNSCVFYNKVHPFSMEPIPMLGVTIYHSDMERCKAGFFTVCLDVRELTNRKVSQGKALKRSLYGVLFLVAMVLATQLGSFCLTEVHRVVLWLIDLKFGFWRVQGGKLP